MKVLLILGCLAVAQCAPTEQAASPRKEAAQQDINAKATPPLREFLILTPEAQLQLQPALKLQQPMIQPITLYSSPGSKRQFDTICSQIQTGVGGIYEIFMNNFPQFGDQGDGSGSKDSLPNQQLELANAGAQTLQLAILPKISAAEHPPAVQHRFYTIAGQPQFFTNEAIVQPHLQPIFSIPQVQAIKGRSVAEPLNAVLQEGNSPNLISQNSNGLPLALPLQSSDNIPMEQLQASENAARNFANDVEKNEPQEELITALAQELLGPAILPRDPPQEIANLNPAVAAKSVDIVEPKELVEAENESIPELKPELQSANLEEQQVNLVPEESANVAA